MHPDLGHARAACSCCHHRPTATFVARPLGSGGRIRTSISCVTGRRDAFTPRRNEPSLAARGGPGLGRRGAMKLGASAQSPAPVRQPLEPRAGVEPARTSLRARRAPGASRRKSSPSGAARGTRTLSCALPKRRATLHTRAARPKPACRAEAAGEGWSGRRGSNPCLELGKFALSH